MKITKLNIDLKLKEIRNLISLWRPRKMTHYGKVTVIKSLKHFKGNTNPAVSAKP